MKVLWADRQAWSFCRKMNTPKVPASGAMVPKPIADACGQILTMMKTVSSAKDWEHVRVKRTVKGGDQPLLLCAFGLPDPRDPSDYRILVLIQDIGRRQESAAEQAQELFQLTSREVMVVRHLLQGLSNKEIAHEIKVTEQTVKEHLQRIMAKTGSTSRSGVLLRILFV